MFVTGSGLISGTSKSENKKTIAEMDAAWRETPSAVAFQRDYCRISKRFSYVESAQTTRRNRDSILKKNLNIETFDANCPRGNPRKRTRKRFFLHNFGFSISRIHHVPATWVTLSNRTPFSPAPGLWVSSFRLLLTERQVGKPTYR